MFHKILGLDSIFVIALISSKKLGGYRLMKNTVIWGKIRRKMADICHSLNHSTPFQDLYDATLGTKYSGISH